jgi:hypothetical protein
VDVPVRTSVVENDDDGDGLIEYTYLVVVGRINDVGDCDCDGECLERKNRELCEHAIIKDCQCKTKREAQEQLKEVTTALIAHQREFSHWETDKACFVQS